MFSANSWSGAAHVEHALQPIFDMPTVLHGGALIDSMPIEHHAMSPHNGEPKLVHHGSGGLAFIDEDEVDIPIELHNNSPVVVAPIGGVTVSEDATDSTFDVSSVFQDADMGGGGGGLNFASFFGGNSEDTIRDVAVDTAGNIYVTGGTASSNFVTTAGAYQTSRDGAHDVFVAKFDADGNLIWSTLLGGSGYDRAYAIEVDATGVYVGGRAGINFPTTAGALQPAFAGDTNPNGTYGLQDGFVSKLSSDGSSLLWSTYFGDASRGFIRDLDIDAGGNVYVAETAVSASNLHVTAGAFQTSLPSGSNGVIAKLTPDGADVAWASYLGGSGTDVGVPSIRVDDQGIVYVLGLTNSNNYPVTAGAFQSTRGGGNDVAVTAFSADGSSLVFSTYLGGSGNEDMETHELALDGNGNVFVASMTSSTDFPTTAGAFQTQYGGGKKDGFVTKFASDGSLVASTYVGGNGHEEVEGIAIDSQGNVVFAGGTTSANYPTAGTPLPAPQGFGAVVVQLSADLASLIKSDMFDGSNNDLFRSIATTSDGQVIAGGMTLSSNFPATNGSSYASVGGGVAARDGVVISLLIPGDYDGDGRVSAADYDLWKKTYGTNIRSADGNNNGVVDVADYTIWRDAYRRFEAISAVVISQVPEPCGTGLMLCGLVVAAILHEPRELKSWTQN